MTTFNFLLGNDRNRRNRERSDQEDKSASTNVMILAGEDSFRANGLTWT